MAHLLLNALRAAYWFDDALQDNLEAAGFKRTGRAKSFIIANIALGHKRAATIARNLGISPQAVSHMLNELEAAGLVTFEADPTDGRARIVTFTTAFRKMGDAALAILSDVETELARRLGADKVAQMRDTLARDWGETPRVVKKPAPKAPAKQKAARSQKRM